MNKYRNHNRRRIFSAYQTMTNVLLDKFKSGKITQEEFDREQEMLDERYSQR